MSDEFSMTGADQLAHVAKQLRAAGAEGKAIRKELYAGLQRATKPLRADMITHAAATMPKRGGLSKRVARSKVSTRTTGGGRNVGVRITVKGPAKTGGGQVDARSIDRGRLRHPTFGHRPYVNQQVTPGAFSEPFDAAAPLVRKELVKAVDTVAKRLARP